MMTHPFTRNLVNFGLIVELAITLVVIELIVAFQLPKQQQQLKTQNVQFYFNMIPSRMMTVTDFDSKVGYITSPYYPAPFPSNSSSIVKLVALTDPNLDAIRLTYEDVDLELSNFCERESVEILVGLVNSSSELNVKKVHVVCGDQPPRELIVYRNSLFIHLFSDPFNQATSRGFKIKYEFLNSVKDPYDLCPKPNHFRCRNRRCIPEHLICNRRDDCGDASDEDKLTPCLDLPTIPYKIDYPCGLVPEAGNRSMVPDLPVKSGASVLANRIVGGRTTGHKSGWPFQVSIQARRVEPVAHFCGGTLIHPLFVLSAAHCFKGFTKTSDYQLIFGSQDLTRRPRLGEQQVRYPSSISIYPGGLAVRDVELNFRQIDMNNDIALIELNAPINMTAHVWPACLPHLSETLVAGRQCLASGFGDTRGTGSPLKLKEVSQKVDHSSTCRALYEDFDLDDYTMICVKNTFGNGACNGDSGGPLFCADDEDNQEADKMDDDPSKDSDRSPMKSGNVIRYLPITGVNSEGDRSMKNLTKRSHSIIRGPRYTVHGVTSFITDGSLGGGFCGLDNVPTIYARISTKVEWILSKITTSMYRLNKADNQQDQNNRTALFGYMFRTGVSRHKNFTRPMTILKSSDETWH